MPPSSIRLLGAIGVVTIIASCAAAPIPVAGPAPDVARLEGEWVGAYSSPSTGRHGDIAFRLAAGADTAVGHVLMIPHTDHEAMPVAREPYDHEVDPRLFGQGLAIRFVAVRGDRVTGQLEPYRDPDCGCDVMTTFEGKLRGDLISGTFASIHRQSGAVREGEWVVTRRSEAP